MGDGGGYLGPKYSRWDFAQFAKGFAPPVWTDVLVDESYLPSLTFDCPNVSQARVGVGYFDQLATNTAADYAINLFLWSNNGSLPGVKGWATNLPLPVAWITQPARGLWVGDSNAPGWCCFYIAPWMGNTHEFENGVNNGQDGRNRHGGRKNITNVLCYDAHAVSWDTTKKALFSSAPYARYGIPPGLYNGEATPSALDPVWRPWAPYHPK